MARFLIDFNLPYYFSLWNTPYFIHQKDINDEWTDEQIWDYAKKNNLTIITKDSDFSNKMMLNNSPPSVITIKFGNLKIKPFFDVMTKVWDDVVEINASHKLVNVCIDRIEAIG